MDDRKFVRLLLVGGNTDDGGMGISVYGFDTADGSAEYLNTLEIDGPSDFMLDCRKKFLYSVSGGKGGGYVNAFSFNSQDGKTMFLNRERAEESPVSCIAFYDESRHIVAGGGAISVFYTDIDGTVSRRKQFIEFDHTVLNKQETGESSIRSLIFSPDGKFLYAADHGAGCIYRFTVDNTKSVDFIDEKSKVVYPLDPEAGPLKIIFHPAKRFMYLLNEYTSSVMVFTHHDGELETIQTIDIDPRETGIGSGIAVSHDGRYLFACQTGGRPGIAVFLIDQKTGMLEKLGFHDMDGNPSDLAFSPEGGYLLAACGDTDFIEVFETDGFTGKLSEVKKRIPAAGPLSLLFV